MSRQLRKLRKELDLQKSVAARGAGLEGSEDDSDGPVLRPTPRTSLFAALGAQQDDDAEDDEADPEEDNVAVTPAPIQDTAHVGDGPKKNKKKKKKKKTKNAATPLTGVVPAQAVDLDGAESEDEIDKALKQLGIDKKIAPDAASAALSSPLTTTTTTTTTVAPARQINDILRVNPYHLRPTNEMKSLFGKEAMATAQAEEQAEREAARQASRRRGDQHTVDLETFLKGDPKEKLPEVSLRRNVFVAGRDHWPRASAEGLTMEFCRERENGREYTFVWDETYEGIQGAFFHFVLAGEPMSLVHLVKQHPYHISALLQASNIAKQDQNAALASELCERALFSFGRVTTSAFRQDLENGTARLDFRRPENRQFWLAAYLYMKTLMRKGTHRTALEWAKVILCLDPKDPYCVNQFVPTLAVKCRQHEWLLQYMERLESTDLCHDLMDEYSFQTRVLACLLARDRQQAKSHLERGVRKLPWLYCALFQALNLDAPPAVWGFQSTPLQEFWTKLYLRQARDLWNNAEAVGFLKETVAAMERPRDESTMLTQPPPITLDVARFVYLEADTSLLGLVPQELYSGQPNFDFDPLPPPEEENVFVNTAAHLPWRHSRSREAVALDTDVADLGTRDRRFREFLAREGRRIVDENGALFIDDEDDENDENDGARAQGINEAIFGVMGGEAGQYGDHGIGGEALLDELVGPDEPPLSAIERIGLEAWLMRQLGQLDRDSQRAEGRDGGETDGREQQEGPDAGGNHGEEEGEDEDEDGMPRMAMPGSWPTDSAM